MSNDESKSASPLKAPQDFLQKSEARVLVRRHVDRLLVLYVKRAGIILGIGSVTAFGGVLIAVYQAAVEVARSEAKQTVDREIESRIKDAQDRINQFEGDFAILKTRKSSAEAALQQLQDSLAKLGETDLSKASAFAKVLHEYNQNGATLGITLGKLQDQVGILEKVPRVILKSGSGDVDVKRSDFAFGNVGSLTRHVDLQGAGFTTTPTVVLSLIAVEPSKQVTLWTENVTAAGFDIRISVLGNSDSRVWQVSWNWIAYQ